MTLTTHLSRPTKSQLLPRLIWSTLKDEAGRALATLLGNRAAHAEAAADVLDIPDTTAARAALAVVRDLSPPFLLGHCMRSYLFGKAIGRWTGMRWDDEVFFLAAVMHDLGLTQAHDGPDSFELNGARAARDWVLGPGGLAPDRADMVHEAIAIHTSVGIADQGGPEMRLVHWGAGTDVLGIKRHAMPLVSRQAIIEAWPRTGFARDFTDLVLDQAARKPDTHICGLVSCGFGDRMLANPIDRLHPPPEAAS